MEVKQTKDGIRFSYENEPEHNDPGPGKFRFKAKKCLNCKYWKGGYTNLALQKRCHSVTKSEELPVYLRPLFTSREDGADCLVYEELK